MTRSLVLMCDLEFRPPTGLIDAGGSTVHCTVNVRTKERQMKTICTFFHYIIHRYLHIISFQSEGNCLSTNK